MVTTATPTTSASIADQETRRWRGTGAGGSPNGSTSIGALGAELELLVLSDKTPLDSTVVAKPGRGSAGNASRARVSMDSGNVGSVAPEPGAGGKSEPRRSSGACSRLRNAE